MYRKNKIGVGQEQIKSSKIIIIQRINETRKKNI